MLMKEYRKKPVIVQAIRWTGENYAEVCDSIDPEAFEINPKDGLVIRTLDGTVHASPGDYIIRGIAGEYYPCKPDIFVKTYSAAEQATGGADENCPCDECESVCVDAKRYERLALIEDILGDTHDVDRLRKLVDADRDGRCVVLPCAPGSTVYTNIAIQGDRYKLSDRPYPVKVVFIGIGEGSVYFNVEYSNGRFFPVELGNVGETIYLSRKAAEAALKEGK